MKKDLTNLLNQIMWGRRYISVVNGNDKRITLVAKDVELQDKNFIEFICTQALNEGKARELLSSAELAAFLDKTGVWTKENDREIEDIKKSLKLAEDTLAEEDISRREHQRTLRIVNSLRELLKTKTNERVEHMSSSLESFVDAARLNATIFSILYLPNGTRYWKEWSDFENEVDRAFITNAIIEAFNRDNFTVTDAREIARSPEWRFRWTAYKNSGDLFGKPICHLTEQQESLVYWSQVYDVVYESMERPADSIINNDESLDKWFEEQSNKRKKEELERSSNSKKNSGIGSSKIWRHGEVGIVMNEGLEGDLRRAEKLGLAKNTQVMSVEEINSMNGPLERKFREHQTNKLKNHGIIAERELRGDANSRRVINSKDMLYKKAKRRDGFTGKQVLDVKPGGTMKGKKI